MSDEEQHIVDGKVVTARYKDGSLEVVEVASYGGECQMNLPEVSSDGEDHKFMQVVEPKDTVVDLLNFTLVRGEDGVESYQLVPSGVEDGSEPDATVTCVLANEDGDEDEGQQYVVVEGDSSGPLVFLRPAPAPAQPGPAPAPAPAQHASAKTDLKNQPITPSEILERAKALQKAKSLLSPSAPKRPRLHRPKRKCDLPPTHELLASPNLKLFLYSCKLCRFKCNAVKELTAHKAQEHNGGGGASGRGRGAGRGAAGALQCARCPYRGSSHGQLMKHVQDIHVEMAASPTVFLDTAEVEAADVLVCGACGFESGSRALFRDHIEREHGATTR